MTYATEYLWLDAHDAERDERIGEHEVYFTLFNLANNRYLGNQRHWAEALTPFLTVELREMIGERFRVVPRCHCDKVWCGPEEWTGSRHEIIPDRHGIIDFDATQAAAAEEWKAHVEKLRATLDQRHAAAAKQRGGYLVALDELAKLDPAERFGAIRTARAALDAVETETVIEERRKGLNWGEIGVLLGTTKQGARQRFLRHDPQGAEAA
jgi:hypothetical protein